MNTLRDFSGPHGNPHGVARDMVEHNNRERGTALTDAWIAIRDPSEKWWDVAYVRDTRTGEVIVCWWAPLESLDN